MLTLHRIPQGLYCSQEMREDTASKMTEKEISTMKNIDKALAHIITFLYRKLGK